MRRARVGNTRAAIRAEVKPQTGRVERAEERCNGRLAPPIDLPSWMTDEDTS